MTPNTSRSGAPSRLPGVIKIMAAGAGVVGANIHYSQPLLPIIAISLSTDPTVLGALPAVTQLGFALSLLLLLPLADSMDRRALILGTVAVAAVALVAHALAPNLGLLLLAAFAVGAASVAPQILSPFAAAIAPPDRQGQASGMILSGILLGVLLSKVIAGVVGAAVGWRWLYGGAAVAMVVLFVVLLTSLPRLPSGNPQRFVEILSSPYQLLKSHGALRLHAGLGALVSASFMIFWSSYALHLFAQFGFGPLVAGLFGLAGIAGSLLAPLAGKAIDQGRATLALITASVATIGAFLIMLVSGANVVGLIVAIVVLDAGVGIAHSSNQARVFRIDPAKRGRLNSVYMFSYFIGGAGGSILGVSAYSAFGWAGVCAVGLAIGLVGLLLLLANRRRLGAGSSA